MRPKAWMLLIAGACGVVSGCAVKADAARARAAREYSCAQDKVQVAEISDSTFQVEACGNKAVYRCETPKGGIEPTCKSLEKPDEANSEEP